MGEVALPANQDGRFLALDLSLGLDNILMTALNGTDCLSAPFVYNIEFQTSIDEASVRGLLGKKLTVWLDNGHPDGDRRPINGMVRKLSGPTPGFRTWSVWQAEIVPLLAFLDFTADCRIFETMSVPDILRKVFSDHALDSVDLRLVQTYPKLDYCVQYRETAFNFVSRLMEHLGMFYFHEHTSTDHKLVIADANSAAKPALPGSAIQRAGINLGDVSAITQDYAFHTGKWTLTDFDFEAPAKNLLADTQALQQELVTSGYEIFDYPGLYKKKDDGTSLTRVRIEHEEVNFHRIAGTGYRPIFDAGKSLTVQPLGGGAPGPNDKLLLTEVHHVAIDPMPMNDPSGGDVQYQNQFVAIPVANAFRPARSAVKPFVRGVQTATVTGPSGETIYTDKYGRVKVKFFWDRNADGHTDENSSCWVRVSQSWADNTFGSIHIPRIGEEVIVDFLEGDPDQPIITGRVYNGKNMVPYKLPDNKTQSGFKSRSVPGSGFNEFRFEDKGGSEEIWMHAQKDLNVKVLNNEDRKIGANQTEEVTGSLTQKVTGDVSETFMGKLTQQVVGNVSETYAANQTHTVGGSVTETIGGSLTQTVATGITITTPATMVTTAVGGYTLTAPGGYNLIAPTSAWQTGPQCLSAYGFNFAAYGANVQIAGNSTGIYASQIQLVGVNFQLNGITSTISGIQQDVQGLTFKEVGAKIENAISNMIISAIFMVL